jgi:glyoxylase-like metal-dependent hydrolase (beta-lactamase superfamily II)
MKMLLVLGLLALATQTSAQPAPGNLDVRWDEGAADCQASPPPPLQVHAYDSRTFILRQNPCADFEANFMYLLVGDEKALLIDTGAVADPEKMPLATTVTGLLPSSNGSRLPLLVVHTHDHADHHAGDGQFESLPQVRIAPVQIEAVPSFFGFTDWPNEIARNDLGGRSIEVIPTPGHEPAHLAFYDDRTALLFSGDFLLPGRLLIHDREAYRDSALRVIKFLESRPVTHILGAHIELDTGGNAYPSGSTQHPNERPLQLGKEDLLALPAALEDFNGFYSRHAHYVLSNPIHNLLALAAFAATFVALAIWGVRALLRRRRSHSS